ncbi:MAG: hypothetical protein LBM77_00135 [Spirochaetaceae bacterium]|nr:hypothetical protein [Spirochaetaceae bacterium]
MMTMQQTITVPRDGHVHLDFTLPRRRTVTQADIFIQIQPSLQKLLPKNRKNAMMILMTSMAASRIARRSKKTLFTLFGSGVMNGKLPDSIIAATAIVEGATLFRRDDGLLKARYSGFTVKAIG